MKGFIWSKGTTASSDKWRTLYGEKERRHFLAITCINTPTTTITQHTTHTHTHTYSLSLTHTPSHSPFFSALPPCPEPPLVRQHQPRHGSCTETLSPKGTRQRYHEGNLNAILSSFVQLQRNPRWCSLWSGLGATRDGCLYQCWTHATLGICISFYASQAKSRNLDRPILQSIRNTDDTQASGRRYTVLPGCLVDCRVPCTQHPSKYLPRPSHRRCQHPTTNTASSSKPRHTPRAVMQLQITTDHGSMAAKIMNEK